MIQRIQTVYLLLSVIATSQLYFFCTWVSNGENSIVNMNLTAQPPLMALWALMMLTQIVPIFQFKNRKRQITFCRTAILLDIIYVVTAIILVSQQASIFASTTLKGARVGFFLPFISIVFLLLAIRNIKKDEELIRSMNRLR